MTSYVNVLEKLHKASVDREFIGLTLQKLLERERFVIHDHITGCQREMKKFEKKYDMSSDEFIDKFNKGKLDDRDEFIKWFSLKDSYDRLRKLQQELGS